MNLKLLEKLVRLANNNSNDNEANSAARRACKLIAEGEFKYIEDKIFQPSQRQEDYFNRYNNYYDQRDYDFVYNHPLSRVAMTCNVCKGVYNVSANLRDKIFICSKCQWSKK